MRRRLLILAAFLLAGAVVNAAVAWSVCLTSDAAVGYQRPLQGIPTWIINLGGRSPDFMTEEHRPSFGMDRREYGTWMGYSACHVSVGWPMRCLAGGWYFDDVPGGRRFAHVVRPTYRVITAWEDHMLPIGPVWPGFAVNTLFYAAVLWLLIFGPFALRWLNRVRRGLCPACAYPRGESDVCSECGKALD